MTQNVQKRKPNFHFSFATSGPQPSPSTFKTTSSHHRVIPAPKMIKDQFAFVNVRHYCATAHLPTTRRIPLHNHHPCLDVLFSADTAQPRRHDVIVNVMLGKKANQFHIFFRERGRSQLNDSLRDSETRRAWAHRLHGDIIVLQKGQRKSYVDIRAADRKMETAAVKRCVAYTACLDCPLTFLTASSDAFNLTGLEEFLETSTVGCEDDLPALMSLFVRF
ncbi:hypothetical protein PLEOSDRAFT_162043 [Pleurotus ostreatus PC15]|uniref:Uncharacterized protein n=1 Tax=Pleurotus ostreatus (strain PC15) TaxID=1137138 RepID=A0A067N7W6_PLEO1|nr:hypothetical protein PLEOSDRAFT_162043 [Pleurotus ostreatus PC15]